MTTHDCQQIDLSYIALNLDFILRWMDFFEYPISKNIQDNLPGPKQLSHLLDNH